MDVYKYLDEKIISCIENHPYKSDITEIRLRADNEVHFTIKGRTEKQDNLYITKLQLEEMFHNMCQKSQNIYESEISSGYITLPGNNRVGIGGDYFYSKSSGKYILKQIKSLNIRLSREVICFENQDVLFGLVPASTLIIGPPHSGKTSLLKLYAEELSVEYRLAVCDERNELYSKKLNCDVISGIKKAAAVSMATRTLNPQFIICDEIGSLQEAEEILSAVNTGVKFICSAHAENAETVTKRININMLLENGVFERKVVLGQEDNKFIIKEVTDV